MKNSELIIGYLNGSIVRGKASSVSVADGKLFSYDTVIAQRVEGNKILFNQTSYSPTTKRMQNRLLEELQNFSYDIHYTIVDIPINTTDLTPYITREVSLFDT